MKPLQEPISTTIKMDEPSSKNSRTQRITNTRTAKQRLLDAVSQPPIVKMLDVFFHSGEIAILFADTGVGKSIFAVGAGNAMAAGQSYLDLVNESKGQKVLYYDYELSDKQFQKRYSDDEGNLFEFNEKFYVSNLSTESYDYKNKVPFDKALFDSIGRDIEENNVEVIIIDNLTYLTTQPLQKQDVAMEIMKQLKRLKDKYAISILVLAHTPKKDNFSPLNLSDLSGAKHISNFADSVFCIGKSSNDPNYRYFKQVKSRNAEMIYGADNVIITELVKNGNCLTFEFVAYDSEWKHLDKKTDVKGDAKLQAIKLYKEKKTIVEISEILGKGKSTIGRWVKDTKPSVFNTAAYEVIPN